MADPKMDLMYLPRLIVKNSDEIFARWARASEQARAREDAVLDVPYGSTPAETLDVFRAKGTSRALLMFIHGGYWRSLDKKDFSFVAPALTRAGVTVAVPNYALCPTVTIPDIVRQMLQASAWLYRNGVNFGAPRHELYVMGHSAGGHLTAMMLAALWSRLAPDLPAQVVKAGFALSGVYDLRPIMKVEMLQNDVRLTPQSAEQASPISYPPATKAPLYTCVGAEENEGFHVQNRIIMDKWKKVHAADVPCPGANHFTILDELGSPTSALHKAALRMMGL